MITTFSAVVLAAGRSTRMGTEKALLRVNDRSLWQRQSELLRQAGASEVFLSARPDQSWANDAAVASHFDAIVGDVSLDCGPLAGIAAALQRVTGAHLAVLAIDLPAMDAGWFRRLAGVAEPAVGIVGRRDGFFEPLAALYPRELCGRAEAALAAKEFSLQRWIANAVADGAMRVTEISAREAALFQNWNTPLGENS